jgi:DNA-binding LytR/AlgR family response regulator
MSPLRVLLADDEPLALERLQFALRGLAGVELVGAAADGEAALRLIERLRPDLVILDIQMPGATGLQVAEALPEEARPEIVFVTAFEHHAPEAFGVEATDYLLKPVRFERLRLAVERARRRRETAEAAGRAAELETVVAALRSSQRPPASPGGGFDAELWVPGRKGLTRVPVDQIDWIEAARDYVLLHTSTRSWIMRATMGSLEKRLDPDRMMRVHRSAFVRPGAVAAVQRPGKGMLALVLADGAEVPVGPAYVGPVTRVLKLGASEAA